jgi:glutaredoxin
MQKVRLYTASWCPFCANLKELLDGKNIPYLEINVDSEAGGLEFTNIQKVTKSDMLPTVIVGNKALVPEKTFITIDQCFGIVQTLLKELVKI